MLSKYIVSKKAAYDIEDFRLYLITENGEKVAQEFFQKTYNKFKLLASYPDIGKSRENISPDLLMFPDVKLRRNIFYRKMDYGVRIIRVLSAYQDYKHHLKGQE